MINQAERWSYSHRSVLSEIYQYTLEPKSQRPMTEDYDGHAL